MENERADEIARTAMQMNLKPLVLRCVMFAVKDFEKYTEKNGLILG